MQYRLRFEQTLFFTRALTIYPLLFIINNIYFLQIFCITHPSPFRSTTATSYPNEDASPGPSRTCSGVSMVDASPSFRRNTTAPLWLALGAPDTMMSLPFSVILWPESRENPLHMRDSVSQMHECQNTLADWPQHTHSHTYMVLTLT